MKIAFVLLFKEELKHVAFICTLEKLFSRKQKLGQNKRMQPERVQAKSELSQCKAMALARSVLQADSSPCTLQECCWRKEQMAERCSVPFGIGCAEQVAGKGVCRKGSFGLRGMEQRGVISAAVLLQVNAGNFHVRIYGNPWWAPRCWGALAACSTACPRRADLTASPSPPSPARRCHPEQSS